jgi:hypothetical protein
MRTAEGRFSFQSFDRQQSALKMGSGVKSFKKCSVFPIWKNERKDLARASRLLSQLLTPHKKIASVKIRSASMTDVATLSL